MALVTSYEGTFYLRAMTAILGSQHLPTSGTSSQTGLVNQSAVNIWVRLCYIVSYYVPSFSLLL